MDTTNRKKVIYDFILRYKQEHDGNSPTLREIKKECGISSISIVNYHLDRMVAIGMLETCGERKQSRSIEVVGGKWIPPKGI